MKIMNRYSISVSTHLRLKDKLVVFLAEFYFLFYIYGKESILFESNFLDGDFDGFSRFENP